MTPELQQFLTVEYQMGTEVDPKVRLMMAEERVAAAKAHLASGHILVKSEEGRLCLIDPVYAAKGFRRERWMTPAHEAAVRGLATMAIGATVELAVRYHPRHGLKTRRITRVG
jgi:hypothetical protein